MSLAHSLRYEIFEISKLVVVISLDMALFELLKLTFWPIKSARDSSS